jgi:hypothetical protein
MISLVVEDDFTTESLTGICPQFEPMRYIRSVFYQLK